MDRIEISSPSVDVAALRGEPPIAPADAPGAAPQDPDESPAPVEPAVAPRRRPSRVLRLAAASGIGLLIVLGLGVGLRLHQHGLAAQEAQPSGGPRKVLFARARPAAAEQTLELPGTVRAIETSLVYGLVGGMVSEMHVHIGDRVKKGQLLALLAAPDGTVLMEATNGFHPDGDGTAHAERLIAADDLVFENAGITAAQLPCHEEGRPVKIGHEVTQANIVEQCDAEFIRQFYRRRFKLRCFCARFGNRQQ